MGVDGWPQSSLVWVGHDGECATVNTALERCKGRNLLRDAKLSLLVVDPDNPVRFIEIRGEAELVSDGALPHLDGLTRRYTGHPRFYGYIYPGEQQQQETRVICRVHPKRIVLDAIHSV
jgi:PPOX class probable F420-dependent enzyme